MRASITDKQVDKLQNVQVQCLKTVVGSKAHSSSSAVEAICGILPFRFRKRELCCREYVRIITQDNSRDLKQLLQSTARAGLRFCPLVYIRVISKQLDQAISGCHLINPESVLSENYIVTKADNISIFNVKEFCCIKRIVGYDDCGSGEVVSMIMEQCVGSSMIFSGESVCGGSVECGASAAFLFPVSNTDLVQVDTLAVGSRVSSYDCEIEAVILGIKMAIRYFKTTQYLHPFEDVFIFSDCYSVIESIVDMKFNTCPDIYMKLQYLRQQMMELSIRIQLVYVKAHTGITGNEMAERTCS